MKLPIFRYVSDIGELHVLIVTVVDPPADVREGLVKGIDADVYVVLDSSTAPMDNDLVYYMYLALRSHMQGLGMAKDVNMEALALSECTTQIGEAKRRANVSGARLLTVAASSIGRDPEVKVDFRGLDYLIGSSTRFRKPRCSRGDVLLMYVNRLRRGGSVIKGVSVG